MDTCQAVTYPAMDEYPEVLCSGPTEPNSDYCTEHKHLDEFDLADIEPVDPDGLHDIEVERNFDLV